MKIFFQSKRRWCCYSIAESELTFYFVVFSLSRCRFEIIGKEKKEIETKGLKQ
jgi:hypothetical protein